MQKYHIQEFRKHFVSNVGLLSLFKSLGGDQLFLPSISCQPGSKGVTLVVVVGGGGQESTGLSVETKFSCLHDLCLYLFVLFICRWATEDKISSNCAPNLKPVTLRCFSLETVHHHNRQRTSTKPLKGFG